VEVPTIQVFLFQFLRQTAALHCVDASSILLSLDCLRQEARLHAPSTHLVLPAITVNVHSFDEVINGRAYHIDVLPVGVGKWRAQLSRIPGGSAATMPFYGSTPDEAAGQLSRWLSLAHGKPRPQL
jgi:hypothetical protein